MSDATTEFFERLAGRTEPEPLLRNASGTVLIELHEAGDTESWFVGLKKGKISLSRHGDHVDAKLSMSRELFDRLCSGTANAMAAVLRGSLVVQGDMKLMILLQRLFPGPPCTCGEPHGPAGYARRQS
jgi:hypothetical protein